MKIDKFTLLAHFTECNKRYFGGILPTPQFKIRHSYFILGFFSCNYDSNYDMYNALLEISDRYDYTYEQFTNVLVHEMIHYYLAYTKEDVSIKHGTAFSNMAKKLNSEYCLNITEKIDVSLYKKIPSFSFSYVSACIFFS